MTCLSQQMGSLAGGSSAALLHRARRERALACDQPAVCMADPSMSGTAGQALGATPAREYQSKEGRAVKVKGPLFRGGGRSALKEFRPCSDGTTHIGQTLLHTRNKTFPGPGPGEGLDSPLRILPVGGLGEIGMNCMLVGHYDRYVMLDAGLMFPDGFDELGMQKVLPDTSFLHKFRDKIEAVIITHGHEDHIGALPWIVPALDPSTPIYSSSFTMALIKKRMLEFGLWNPARFKLFEVGKGKRFSAGPFEVEAVRVTHSIPDCSGLFFRCADGTIVHTGDWKIDEQPMDGEMFDRSAFEAIGNEGVTLLMSDSTNVLSPGRTVSESSVAQSLLRRVCDWTSGRIVATCFASNIHRLEALKAAADASDRKLVLCGMSLSTYLEAAFRDKRASFSPAQLIDAEEAEGWDPNKLLIVTTGSQAEPRAMLSRAAYGGAKNLKIGEGDLLLYSAKMIPGNEKRVMKMLNALSSRGAELAVGRGELLHASGHAHQEELTEVLRLVKPQHFLPVHGEYAFLKEHEALGRAAGCKHTSVISNGQMLGVAPLRSGKQLGRAGHMQLLGETRLQLMYNDGNASTSGTKDDVALEDRVRLANEGLIVATVRVYRSEVDIAAALEAGYLVGKSPGPEEALGKNDDKLLGLKAGRSGGGGGGKWGAAAREEAAGGSDRSRGGESGPRLQADVKLQLRALYTAGGAHLVELQTAADEAVQALSAAAPGWEIERAVRKACLTVARRLLAKKPDILVCSVDCVRGAEVMEKMVLSAATQKGLKKAAAKAKKVAA